MLLLGKEVSAALNERTLARAQALIAKGIQPTLAIVRCGERPDDVSYETSACKRAAALSIAVVKHSLPADAEKTELLALIDRLNGDRSVHGVLLFRPLPAHLKPYQDEICNRLTPQKDIDGMTDLSAAGVFCGKRLGFAPCTAAACVEVLNHYGIDCTGKRAVVIGRSPVVGKPAALLLMAKNATVTVCHTKTRNLPEVIREADIIVSAAGVQGSLTAKCVRAGQVVVDVSINWDERRGCITGDADFDAVSPIVDAITPVPGGVGTVTTAILMAHVAEAAENLK